MSGSTGLARTLVERNFAVEDGELVVGGCRIAELAASHGTPLYVYDGDVLESTWRALCDVVPDGVDVHYSVKANPLGAVLRAFLARGCGLEVASAGELERALRAGADPGRIVFAGPGKTTSEIERALAAGVGELHVESIGELDRLAALAEPGAPAPVVLRVNPGEDAQAGAMRMGGRPAPFGIDEAALDAAVDRAEADPALDLRGVHVYVGTQILDVDLLAAGWLHAVALARRVAERTGRPVSTIDLGGGLGVPYFDHESRLDPSRLGRALEEAVGAMRADSRLAGARAILEPGRFLVAEAGVYVARVVDVKASRGTTFAVLDGGMHHHLAASGNLGQTIKRNFPIVAADRLDEAPGDEPVEVVGPLCTPLDALGRKVALPPLEPGDLVAVLQSGAYARSASPLEFLSHPAPPEVWAAGGEAVEVRRRGATADLLRDEVEAPTPGVRP